MIVLESLRCREGWCLRHSHSRSGATTDSLIHSFIRSFTHSLTHCEGLHSAGQKRNLKTDFSTTILALLRSLLIQPPTLSVMMTDQFSNSWGDMFNSRVLGVLASSGRA